MGDQYAKALQQLEDRRAAQLADVPRSPGQVQGSGTCHDPNSIVALLDRKLPAIDWAVDDLIEYGTLTLVVARPKAGKGWLCLQLMEAVGSGTEFLGRRTNQEHVLYVAAEDKQDGITRRLQLMNFNRGTKGRVLDFSAENQAEALAWLVRYLFDHPEVRLVILDTLRYFFGTREESRKNAQDQDFEILKPLRELAVRSGVGIIAVMHERKPPGSAKAKSMDISDSMAGSLLIAGTAETTLRLLRSKSKVDQRDLPDAQLQIMGRQVEATDTIHIRFNGDIRRFETASEEAVQIAALFDGSRTGSTRAQILEALQSAGGRLHRDGLRQRLCGQGGAFGTPSVTPGALRQTLQRLKQERILAEDTEGYVRLSQAHKPLQKPYV